MGREKCLETLVELLNLTDIDTRTLNKTEKTTITEIIKKSYI